MKRREVQRRQSLVLLTVLSANGFLNPFGLMSSAEGKLLFYAVMAFAMAYVLSHKTRQPKPTYSRFGFALVMTGLVSSVFMTTLFQQQPLSDTLITTTSYALAYLSLPIMSRLSVPRRKLLKVIYICAAFGMVAYLANLLCFPRLIFGEQKEEYDMSRGFIRLGVPFILFVQFVLFHRVNNWVNGTGRHNLVWIAVASVFVFLSMTRQVIALSGALALLLAMQRSSMVKRVAVAAACLALVYVVLPAIPSVRTMIELTEDQSAQNKYKKEDIRITAWRYYTIENQTNEYSPLFGNGVPRYGHSQWGKKTERAVDPNYGGNACFQADVGWAGFYWYFGAIGTAGLALLLLTAALKKKTRSDAYLSYVVWNVIITSVASAPILYHYQVVMVMLVICFIYAKEDSDNNPQLQQLRGHDKLY